MQCYGFPALVESFGGQLSALSNIQKIELAEYLILQSKLDDFAAELPLNHRMDGVTYEREIFLPKGTLLTGKVHNFDHVSVISIGDVTVMTPEGTSRIVGPCIWESRAGTKRLIYVHEDTIWTTFHATNKTELSEIERELVHDSDLSWIETSGLLPGGNNDICSGSSCGCGGGGRRLQRQRKECSGEEGRTSSG